MITDEFYKPREKTHSVYAFIAVCDSARELRNMSAVMRHVVALQMKQSNATPLRGVRRENLHASAPSPPCAVAHGYKRISAMRLGATQIQSFELFNKYQLKNKNNENKIINHQ